MPKFLGPFMVQQLFSQCAETLFGSHPCRVFSVSYKQTLDCNGILGTFCNREERTAIAGNGEEQ